PAPGSTLFPYTTLFRSWKRQGIKTVVNLRGQRDEAYYWLEKDACDKLGLTLIDAPLDSRDPPGKDRVRRAKVLFQTIEYPALIQDRKSTRLNSSHVKIS